MNYNVWGKYFRYQHNCEHGGGKSGRPTNIGKWYTVRSGVNNVDNCIHFPVTASFSLSSWAGCYHTCAHTRLTGRCACIYILKVPYRVYVDCIGQAEVVHVHSIFRYMIFLYYRQTMTKTDHDPDFGSFCKYLEKIEWCYEGTQVHFGMRHTGYLSNTIGFFH